MSHCWTSAFNDHFDHCFVVFKNVQLRLALRRMCVCGDVIHLRHLTIISVSLWFGFGCVSRRGSCLTSVARCWGWFGVFVLFVEHNTSTTTSHESRAAIPSIRSPASNEMISDSLDVWDTDVCFLHVDVSVESQNSSRLWFVACQSYPYPCVPETKTVLPGALGTKGQQSTQPTARQEPSFTAPDIYLDN